MPERAKPAVVYLRDMEVTMHPEFGLCMEWKCPDCEQTLRVFQWLASGNILKCRCSEWNLLFEARGLGTG